jgi:HEAT repeat protein
MERARIATLSMVVAVAAILVMFAPRGSSEPPRRPAIRRVVPTVTPTVGAGALAAPVSAAPDDVSTALAALAHGRSCGQRLAAVERLRVIGDPVAIPALLDTLEDESEACAVTATRATIRELLRRRGQTAAY